MSRLRSRERRRRAGSMVVTAVRMRSSRGATMLRPTRWRAEGSDAFRQIPSQTSPQLVTARWEVLFAFLCVTSGLPGSRYSILT